MPELPEVETVINILKPLIIGKTIDKIDIFYDRLIQSDYDTFTKKLIGRTFKSVDRYGKYIFLNLDENLTIITHLRMEGKFRFTSDTSPRIKATSLIFEFKDKTYLCFDDTRKFGLMYLTNTNEKFNVEMIKKLGVEANKVTESDKEKIFKKLNANKKIKELLLDQTIMCGIGNIYADEILYKSHINPFTKGKDLTTFDYENIVKFAKITLEDAIKAGGSTIHSFHPSEGVDGRFQVQLTCYGKEGEICPNCGTTFHKTFIGGRGTTYCPNCQVNPYLRKAIGITGPIGSGKSSVLSHLASLGYVTLNCDDIIHELYRMPIHKNKISKILHTDFDIDNQKKKQTAKLIMINDPLKKKAVENYIYPKLEEILVKHIEENEKVAIEVPLLFKAHFEYMFSKIFVIELSKEKQISNLKIRNDEIEKSLKLNNDYYYNKDNKFIINIKNKSTLEDLFNQIDSFLN
ncbi:MAG: DNA-formamidopyrimidine glycosylase [Bacilli bacterium]|nr:DNA-formamidopyrimidine glycosylase [Bacilli bacterium]